MINPGGGSLTTIPPPGIYAPSATCGPELSRACRLPPEGKIARAAASYGGLRRYVSTVGASTQEGMAAARRPQGDVQTSPWGLSGIVTWKSRRKRQGDLEMDVVVGFSLVAILGALGLGIIARANARARRNSVITSRLARFAGKNRWL